MCAPREAVIAHISTYPPRECGIAVYTKDLVQSTGSNRFTQLVMAVDDGLLAFGESVRHAVYYHIQKSYQVKREEVPDKLEAFHKALKDLFGAGATIIEKLMAKNLCSRLNLKLEDHQNWTIVDYVAHVKKLAGK